MRHPPADVRRRQRHGPVRPLGATMPCARAGRRARFRRFALPALLLLWAGAALIWSARHG